MDQSFYLFLLFFIIQKEQLLIHLHNWYNIELFSNLVLKEIIKQPRPKGSIHILNSTEIIIINVFFHQIYMVCRQVMPNMYFIQPFYLSSIQKYQHYPFIFIYFITHINTKSKISESLYNTSDCWWIHWRTHRLLYVFIC